MISDGVYNSVSEVWRKNNGSTSVSLVVGAKWRHAVYVHRKLFRLVKVDSCTMDKLFEGYVVTSYILQ